MGKETGIAWCDHTFNPWWGCFKVSPACANCYAATLDHRLGGDFWQLRGPRKFFGDRHWKQPLRWDADACHSGKRALVFCASMADVFEDRPDLVPWRARLFDLIRRTQYLDWLLLTKRPENMPRMYPGYLDREPWPNVWLGTTVERMIEARERLPHLLAASAVVHFVSAEPLLGELDLTPWLTSEYARGRASSIDWVITGCESGHGARPQNVDWYRSLRDQCAATGTAFFLKQAELDEAVPPQPTASTVTISAGPGSWRKRDGIVEQPYLDGVQHVEFPKPRSTFRHIDSKEGDTSHGVR